MGRIKVNKIGEEGYNKFGSKMIIINQYRDNNRGYIDVYFPEYNWTAKNIVYDQFKKGTIKCPYEPRLYSKGYLGDGKYKVKENNKTTKYYHTWYNMLNRCYSDKYHKTHPAYKGCEVNEYWLNFQNMGEWLDKHYYEVPGERMCLDKDILVHGNKIYSPDTCLIVPERINNLFIKNNRNRNDILIGTSPHSNKYQCSCYDENSEHIYLGAYESQNEAFKVYKSFKENIIKKIADKYYNKGYIPKDVYEALYNYEVLITD